MEPTPAPEPRVATKRFAMLDGLRGFASVYVMICHAFLRTTEGYLAVGGAEESAWFKAFRWIQFAGFQYWRQAVILFIVLSGFCLALPFASRTLPEWRCNVPDFLSRRFQRIYPPYVFALLLATAVCALTGFNALSTNAFLHHLFLTHNWTRHISDISPPLWSIALECQIYLVFAVVLLPLIRRAGMVVAVATALLISLLPTMLGTDVKFWHLGAFGFGMAAAHYSASGPRNPNAFRRATRIPVATLGGLYCIVLALQNKKSVNLGPFDWDEMGMPWMTDLVGALLFSLAIARTATIERGGGKDLLGRIASHRIPVAIGLFSYSLYLHHDIFFDIAQWILPRRIPAMMQMGLDAVVLPVAALIWSWWMYRLVERHFPRRRGAEKTIASTR